MSGLEIFAAALSAGSAVVGAAGAIRQGNAEAASAEYNAQINERNAIVADQNRKISLEQARVDVEDKRRENRRNLSSIRAAYGASGLDLAGSPLDVLEDTAIEMELDASRIDYEGRMDNRQGGMEANALREGATLSRMEGKSAKTASRYSAAGQFLGGAGRALARVA